MLDELPLLQGYLRENPSMVKSFVGETLRYDGPAKNLCRQTTADLTITGVPIPANSRVMWLMGSANHDERVFTNPETFDRFREFTAENKIMTFGEGIHSCMGAPLARLTAQVAVEELVTALGGTELRVVGIPERWAKQMVRGFSKLPVKIVTDEQPHSMRLVGSTSSHIGSVQQKSTRLRLTTREFEAVARVDTKITVAEGVAALTLVEIN